MRMKEQCKLYIYSTGIKFYIKLYGNCRTSFDGTCLTIMPFDLEPGHAVILLNSDILLNIIIFEHSAITQREQKVIIPT